MTAAKVPSRPPTPPRARVPQRLGDRIFSGSARTAGILILVILAGVALFLIVESIPAITAPNEDLPDGESLAAYVGPLLFGTLLAAVIALVVATPLAVGIALFITHFAPRRLAQPLAYIVDLLAAIPSVVFGMWGIVWLAPRLVPFYDWLAAATSASSRSSRDRRRSPDARCSPPASCWRS